MAGVEMYVDSHTSSALPVLSTASPKDLASAEFKSMGQHSAWVPDPLVTGPLMVFLKQIIFFPPSKCLALKLELLYYF